MLADGTMPSFEEVQQAVTEVLAEIRKQSASENDALGLARSHGRGREINEPESHEAGRARLGSLSQQQRRRSGLPHFGFRRRPVTAGGAAVMDFGHSYLHGELRTFLSVIVSFRHPRRISWSNKRCRSKNA